MTQLFRFFVLFCTKQSWVVHSTLHAKKEVLFNISIYNPPTAQKGINSPVIPPPPFFFFYLKLGYFSPYESKSTRAAEMCNKSNQITS